MSNLLCTETIWSEKKQQTATVCTRSSHSWNSLRHTLRLIRGPPACSRGRVRCGRPPAACLFTCFGRSTLIGSDPLLTSCWDNREGPAMLTYWTSLPHTAGPFSCFLNLYKTFNKRWWVSKSNRQVAGQITEWGDYCSSASVQQKECYSCVLEPHWVSWKLRIEWLLNTETFTSEEVLSPD